MKFCPSCKTAFPNEAELCPTHGIHLSEIVDLKPGMLIRSTYRIVRKLGEGGFGAVYLAEQTLMGELRAIKLLSAQSSRDEGLTARFRREVRTLRQVRHRNVVDCGDLEKAEDGTLFFSMEYVDGPDLRHYLNSAREPITVAGVLAIARQIAEGLGAAHAQGLVHRDIKPENILLASDLVPKIADFGIVATRESSTAHTQTGLTLLTMAYAAPEQWRGTPAANLGGRTDLYALGGVLFEMLTGETVFRAESYEGWARQHLNVAPRAPSSLRPELARWHGLDALVALLLAKDPTDRPQNVAELLKLLDAVRFLPSRERQPTVVESRTLRPATPEEPAFSRPEKRRVVATAPARNANPPRSRMRGWVIALLTAGLAISAFLLWPRDTGEIFGTVTNASGTPIANVQVNLNDFDILHFSASTTTGADGTYKFTSLKYSTTYSASFHAPGFVPDEGTVRIQESGRLGNWKAQWDKKLGTETRTGVLAGVVKDADRKTLPGVSVTLYNSWEYEGSNISKRTTRTRADGSYRFDSLPFSGAYWLTFDADGFDRAEGSVGEVRDDHTTQVDAFLQKSGRGRSQLFWRAGPIFMKLPPERNYR